MFGSKLGLADTLHLANGGTVSGTVLEVRLRIGPIEKVLPRGHIASLKIEAEGCQAVDNEQTLYVGVLESVVIRCVAGTLTFGGKSVLEIELGTGGEPVRPPPAITPARQEPEPRPEPGAPAQPHAVAQEKARAVDLLKTAARLRDAYLEEAAKLEKAEYQKFKDKYLPEYEAACKEAKQRADAYAKFAAKDDAAARQPETRATPVARTGAAGEALQALELAEAKKRKLMLRIKSARDEIRQVAAVRRDRIRAYYAAISRDIAAGKLISEEAMEKIYTQALAVGAD